jgi:hypothetical protein
LAFVLNFIFLHFFGFFFGETRESWVLLKKN